LIQAQQSLRDTQALLAQNHVLLVKNLGGGWQREDAEATAPASGSAVRPVAQQSTSSAD
jgi:outer membrane protein TolC